MADGTGLCGLQYEMKRGLESQIDIAYVKSSSHILEVFSQGR